MKNLILFAITTFSMATVQAYTGYGICNYGKEKVDSVICYGPAVLKQTTISGNIKVTGSLQAENITAKGLQVEGSVNIKNSLVGGPVNITGALHADHVEFKTGIAVTSNNIILNNAKVKGLISVTSPDKTPYVQVQCSSVVTGSVLFDGKPGIVQITGDSLVQGKVVNGSLEFVKRDCD